MLRRVLDDAQEELLAEERRLLAALDEALARFAEAAEDRKILRRAALQLDELFLLVVAGEFNSGKSAFVNALVGSPLLAEGVTPTTTRIQLLRYGDAPAPPATAPAPPAPAAAPPALPAEPAVDVVTAPLELLREIHIVDTPGTNAIHREHEAITRDFVPRSDLVLFVTSADRPFTESERAFLQGIREWGKKVVLAINKIDILDSPAAVDEVRAFVAEHAAALLGAAPDVFPVSARQAQRAKAAGDAALAAASRFAALEDYIVETLDERQRLRLKLLNPLGIAGRLAARYRELAAARLALLAGDVAAIDDVERQLALYREDMAREFRFRLADVAGVLQELEARGMQFFDDTLRLGRVLDLLNKPRIKAEFGKHVVGDAPQVVDRRVHEAIDWMIAADLRQWPAARRARRPHRRPGRRRLRARPRAPARERRPGGAGRGRALRPGGRVDAPRRGGAGSRRLDRPGRGGGDRPRRAGRPRPRRRRRRRHRRAGGERRGGARPVHHPQPAPGRQARAARQDRRPARAAHGNPHHPVRPRARARPAPHRRRHRPLHPLRARRGPPPRRHRRGARPPDRPPRGARPAHRRIVSRHQIAPAHDPADALTGSTR